MKSRLWLMLSFCFLLTARAAVEEPASEPMLTPVPGRSPEELEQLFGPIALYPDALIALILPASTVPSDVVLASRYLKANGDPSSAENEIWDDSVKALVHYPDVIKWMDQNLAWTKQAGAAFVAEPVAVMNAIQRLRAKARAAGTLVDTAQQQVVVEGDAIRIIPAKTYVIYVPVYDPAVVYVSRPDYYSDPFLTFGVGWATGYWLGYNVDWGHRRIWTVDRHHREQYWHNHADWRRPSYPSRPDHVDGNDHQQPWKAPNNYPRSPSYVGNGGNRSHPDRPSPNPSVNTPMNRAPDSNPGRNRSPGTPTVNRDWKQDSDGRGNSSNQRHGNTPSSTTQNVVLNPANHSDGGVKQPGPNQPPRSSPQSNRGHADRVPQARSDPNSGGFSSVPQNRQPTSVTPSPRPVSDVTKTRTPPPAPSRIVPSSPIHDQSARFERPPSVAPTPRPMPDSGQSRMQPSAPSRTEPSAPNRDQSSRFERPSSPTHDQSARFERPPPATKVDGENRVD